MANEWQSLLQAAPNVANLNLVKTFQDSYGTAQDQKIKAYDQFRLQKAQEIASKSRRKDGTMDWDSMFNAGAQAGIGLDAFNQVHKMQTERRASELANAQNRVVLESMGYDPSQWDNSAASRVQVAPGGTPYLGKNENNYDYVTNPLANNTSEINPPVIEGQGVGQTATTPAPINSSDLQNPGQNVELGEKKIQVYQMPTPEMRDPDKDNPEGYYNELWRAQRDQGAIDKMLSAGNVAGAKDATLAVTNMKTEERENLSRYLAMRGMSNKDPQLALSELEANAVNAVALPQLNPMLGMMNKEKMAEEWGRYNQAKTEYPAKVQEARNKVSEAIKSGNFEVLDKTLEVAKNKRSQEEHIRSREASKTLVNMGVTENMMPDADVKSLQDVFIPAIADISQAQNGFGGAMQAAIAKAKVDGSINFDAILSNLVAMGAMPSKEASQIKMRLTPEAYTAIGPMVKAGTVDNLFDAFNYLGGNIGAGTGATNKNWLKASLDNVFEQAQAHGMTEKYYNKQKNKVIPWQGESPSDVFKPEKSKVKNTKTPKVEVIKGKDGRVRPKAGW